MTAVLTRPLPPPADPTGRATTHSPTGSANDHGTDLESLARELDALRDEVLASRGATDAAYIRRMIRVQRGLELAGRATLMAGVLPPAWLAGVAMLSLAKILENMEVGHNVMHAQWDWMQDPAIHSTTWEWDNVCPSDQWRHSHNYMHHQFTNVEHLDLDVGYGILRVHPDQKWSPVRLIQPAIFVTLASLFEYGVGIHDLDYDVQGLRRAEPGSEEADRLKRSLRTKLKGYGRKIARQVGKDYVGFPLLALPLGVPSALAVLTGNLAANFVRNLWSFAVIFCGHFPDGTAVYQPSDIENETQGGWYRRQILGSANFTGGRLLQILSGNLCHQIEHHLFPDLPSNRYAEIAPRVRDICERHGLAYNTGSFARQFGTVVRKVLRLSLPGGGTSPPRAIDATL